MFITVQGKFINVNHIVMVEKVNEKCSKIFLSYQSAPILISLSHASILGKIHRSLGILDENEEDKMPSLQDMYDWEVAERRQDYD
ncbi:hypothetical protein ACVRXQ_12035 [Streptococcus panodentis]|uniref:Uncharacterized protein n=1 Tax=Streptococcus panodentis TaxID=1581472 RepID=A0ABS5AZK7_9STRE|nr:hypothetical protein [Streptococcus panodentis]MBP2621139.1 hypothetical protein [Streptococcus panodentis]